MQINKKKVLSGITSVLKGIELPGAKKILPLPNDLVFVIDTRDNVESYYMLDSGLGHEPYMINKIMAFTRLGEVYVEVGANYGDFALQESYKVGSQGKVYAFEPGKNLFQCFSMSIFLNGISNIVLENLAILDKPQKVTFFENVYGSLESNVVVDGSDYNQNTIATNLDSYFKDSQEIVSVMRLDAEGNECKILRGAKNIIDSSTNLRIFIEWQASLLNQYESEEEIRECLSILADRGFIFLDILEFDNNCFYKNYQLSTETILASDMLEFLAIQESTLKEFIEFGVSSDYKEQCVNHFLFTSVIRNNPKNIETSLSQGAYIDYMHSIGSTDLYMTASRGINVDKVYPKFTALYMAVEQDKFDAAEYLLKSGANPNIKTEGGTLPLCIAAQNKNLPMVKLLVENGADIEYSYSNNATTLYLATYVNSEDMVKYLLEKGASKNVTVGGFSTFERAIELKHYEIARLLAADEFSFCQEISELDIYQEYIEYCGQIGNFDNGGNF